MAVKMDKISEELQDELVQVRSDLERLVKIPSVSAPGYPREPIDNRAQEVANLLRESGCHNVRLEHIEGGADAVVAEIPGPNHAPHVLLYAHYDVQPAETPGKWTTLPFEPTVRDGRLYGRGSADDKSGVVMHAATVRAFRGRPPVSLTILVEGEEETASHLDAHVSHHAKHFAADAYVIADVGNVRLGVPTITTTLRGLASVKVTVRTLRTPVHSGMFGGPAPDALMALIRLLASLHDDAGDVVVEGLASAHWDGYEYPSENFRDVAGVLDDVPLIGSGTVSEMLWARPSVSVVGLDAQSVANATNALAPEASAIVSVRIIPGQNPEAAVKALEAHLHKHAPWGLNIEVEALATGSGFAAARNGRAFQAAEQAMEQTYGREVALLGQGGSIPLVDVLSSLTPAHPGEVILWGAQDESAHIHGIDESVDLQELMRCIEQQVRFLDILGGDRKHSDPASGTTKGTST